MVRNKLGIENVWQSHCIKLLSAFALKN